MSLGLFVGRGDAELKLGVYETEDGLSMIILSDNL